MTPMPNDTPKLKPCPCCGGKAETAEYALGWVVQCVKCRLRTNMQDHVSRSIANWNRRTHE